MTLDAAVLQGLTKGTPEDAWRVIIKNAVEIAAKPLGTGNAPSEVTKRDREIGTLDHFLATSGWDLWQAFGDTVERTSDRLMRWWAEPYSAKAVLILDGLSLRELPWLLQGAKERGFTLHEVTANASELPGETNEFARALGFGSRSQLQNNGGGMAHKLTPINLQFARILFNFDLPWNPMDIEQRIGRIHRYGQNHTAQVYNLVLSDTIEGRIFLMLDEKLTEIARTVGKVDDQGNVAEDLRAQILGQLSERLNYDRLYQEALSDPELKRTKVELEAALSNSREARQVVFDLFQDLQGFSLDDYKPFSDISSSLDRLVQFMSTAVADRQQRLVKLDDETYDLVTVDGARRARFTLNRDTATSSDDVDLMGLDHPLIQEELGRWRSVPPEELGIAVAGDVDEPVLLSFWMVEASAGNGERRVVVQPIAVKQDGTRVPAVERQCERYLQAPTTTPKFSPEQRLELFSRAVEPTLQRELKHKGSANGDGSYSAELIGYVEIVA